MVNPGETASQGVFFLDHVFLVNTDAAYRAAPETPQLSGPSEGFGQYLLSWTDVSSSGGFLYRLEEDTDAGFANPTIFYSADISQLISAPHVTGNQYYRVNALSGPEGHSDTRASTFSNTVAVNLIVGPPVIEKVDSFVGDDTDNIYAAGSLVRINVLELYRADNVVSGRVRITSASTGYDSGAQPLAFDPAAESWFFHWVTNDLSGADDYVVQATLTNDLGLTDPDGTDDDPDLTISLTLEPPLITTLFEVEEFTVPARGLDVAFVRTYKASSLFEGIMGRGWYHSYEIFLERNMDGSAVVTDGPRGELFYLPDGSGGFSATKPNNYAELFSETDGYRLRFKDGTTYRFSLDGKLRSMADRNGNTLSFAYNENGLLSIVTDASNQTTTFGYALFGGGAWRLTDVTDPFGRIWYFVYHPDNTLFAVEDPLGHAENYFYHPNQDLAIRIDRSGVQTFYNYLADEKRRLASRNIPGDIDRIDYRYGPGAEIELTDGLGRVTRREFNASGLLIKETDPLLNVTRFEYDSARNLTKVIDARGKESVFTYDGKGNLLTSQDPLLRASSFTYEPVFNEVSSSTDPRGNTTFFRYDPEGNLAQIEDLLTNITSFFYDEFGNLLRTRDPLAHETTFTYTPQGLVETAGDALGNATGFVYDARGNVLEEIDPAGNRTQFTYDLLNHITSTTDRVGAQTLFSYTPTGKIKTLTDHNGRIVLHNYDFAERLTGRVYPDGSSEQFAYDRGNNVTQIQDRSGIAINYRYDALDRLSKRIFPDGTEEVFSYDELGRLISASNMETDVTFAYNDLGDLIAERISRPTVKTLRHAYDADGNRILRIDHKNRTVAFSYDKLNRLERITASGGIYEYHYDEASRLTKKILANGVATDFSYDPADRLLSLISKRAAGTLQEFLYTYDRLGNIRTKTSSSGLAAYEYDPAEQIVREDDPLAGIKPIIYDPLGNRVSAASVNYTTNILNQYTQAAAILFTYDGAGRMKTRNVPGVGVTAYQYDFLGRLKEVQEPNGTVIRFTYDPLGRRHSKTVMSASTSSTIYFLHDGDQVLSELDAKGNEFRSYLWGPTVDELLSQTQRRSTYYILHDHQYTVTGITDSTGSLIQSYTYDAFGNPTDGITKRLTPYAYTGREYESELNLYFYRNRFYDSTLSRFISPDPLLFVDGPNLYTYVGNNALNFSDPSGLCTDCNKDQVPDKGTGKGKEQLKELQRRLERQLNQIKNLLERGRIGRDKAVRQINRLLDKFGRAFQSLGKNAPQFSNTQRLAALTGFGLIESGAGLIGAGVPKALASGGAVGAAGAGVVLFSGGVAIGVGAYLIWVFF
ncbi:MAG: RHS repeat protein [Candidatus Omnitrophica bacterium]|nr:RHS repeat protein [Candidatus Omnitrophota bacterium]